MAKGAKKSKKLTQAQVLLGIHLSELDYTVVYEYRFHDVRQWRFDLYLPQFKVGIECDGGMWSGGHTRSNGLEMDYEKQNEAQALGFKIFRFTNRQVLTGEAKDWLRKNLPWLEKNP